MRKYSHLGLPTNVPRPGETYIAQLKTYISCSAGDPYGIQWMRHEPDCPLPERVKTFPHLAFEVDDLAAELAGKDIVMPPTSPSDGMTIAFILHDGVLIELLEFHRSAKTAGPM